jgi:hypothetical protein
MRDRLDPRRRPLEPPPTLEQLHDQRERLVADSPPVELRWSSRRGRHLTGAGRWLLVLSTLAGVGAFAAVLLIPGPYQDVTDALACAGLLTGFAAFMGILYSWQLGDAITYADEETASWTLQLSPAAVRLAADYPDRCRRVRTIERADASTFELVRSGTPAENIAWAVADSRVDPSSVRRLPHRALAPRPKRHDRRPVVAVVGAGHGGVETIRVPNRPVPAPPEMTGLRRVTPALVLAWWWPWSEATAEALSDTEVSGSGWSR